MQEAEAREAGFAEIVQLLSSPEDLSRLGALRAQYESHAATNKALLSNTVQSQVSADSDSDLDTWLGHKSAKKH